MPDLLLELRSEEIPARMQRKAAGDLKKMVTDGLVEAGLTYEGCREYWTPRRLALDLRGLSARSADIREERRGPGTKAPQAAIEGFLRSAGLADIAQAHIHSDPKKGDFYVAHIVKPGRSAAAIIAELVPAVIRSFPWPKSMRWGAASGPKGTRYDGVEGLGGDTLRWVRPLQSILCTFGPETEEPVVVDFEVGGIRSGNVTFGHRFHAPGPITVRRFEDYAAALHAAKVVIDPERRKAIILEEARTLAFASGLELVEDEGLLEEVSGLVEWPVVLMGVFDEDFLVVPAEIIRLTIRANQKCFVVRPSRAAKPAPKDALSNRFLLTANIEARDHGAEIVRGNGKVVRARLSDALYFWKTDQADLPDLDRLRDSAAKFALDLKKPLDQRMARLDRLGVTFHAKLGTQGERVARIARLAQELAPVVGADLDLAHRSAVLAKADLQTETVGEFPELQGVMGRKYAALQGEHPSVAAAIEEHYKPQGPSDRVPSDPVSAAVALADKLDTLAGFWAIDEKPTGSKDPFALRRAALGVIRIVLENGLRLSLKRAVLAAHGGYAEPAIEAALDRYADSQAALAAPDVDGEEDLDNALAGRERRLRAAEMATAEAVAADLLAFFHERLKVYLREQGARHDLIDAVLAGSRAGDPAAGEAKDDLLAIVRRVEALGGFLDAEDGRNLLAGTRRAANILAAEEKKGTAVAAAVDPALLREGAERTLFEAVNQAESSAAQAIGAEDFSAAMRALSALRAPVDAFFDQVLVNDPDVAVRANRLALLSRIRAATGQVADFSRIAG